MHRLAVSVLITLAVVAQAWSQDVQLRLKLRAGETLTYTVELSGNGTIAAMGMTEPMVTRGTLVYTQRVLSVDPQGNAEVRTTCSEPKIAAMWGQEVIPVRLTIPPIVATMAPTGQITHSKVEPVADAAAQPDADALGLDESLSLLAPLLGELGLGGGRPTMMDTGRDFFNTSKLFGTLRTPGFPATPVAVGAQWHETINLDLEHSNALQTKCDSQLLALQPVNGEAVATIRTAYETPLGLPMDSRGGLFTISGTDKGSVMTEFSVERGRVLKSVGQTVSTMKMEAGEAVGLLGMPVDISMSSTTKYEVKLK